MMKDGNFYIDRFSLMRPDHPFQAALCCCFFPQDINYKSLIPYLHAEERYHFNCLRFNKRIRTYLMGRLTAKLAVGELSGEQDLTKIFIQSGIFNHPIVNSDEKNIQVSITHCDNFGAALAFPEAHPMGIDIESIDRSKRNVLEELSTFSEKQKIVSLPLSYDEGLALLWTAKEALSKVLKTGLMTPFKVFEISGIDILKGCVMAYYKNFAQYKVISFNVGKYLCSIVHPMKTEMGVNLQDLKKYFQSLNKAGHRVEDYVKGHHS